MKQEKTVISKRYKIPVVLSLWGLVEVEAKDLEEAKKKAMRKADPIDMEYIEDSCQIDEEGLEENWGEVNNE